MKSLKQTFPIIFNNHEFLVDPIPLLKISSKFKELFHPLHDFTKDSNLQLVMLNVDVDLKSVGLFFNLCQEIPTDIPNSNMKDICELAKFFKTNDIYDKYIKCIHENIDQKFDVPDNKYDLSSGNVYLHIESKTKPIPIKTEDSINDENKSIDSISSTQQNINTNNVKELNSSQTLNNETINNESYDQTLKNETINNESHDQTQKNETICISKEPEQQKDFNQNEQKEENSIKEDKQIEIKKSNTQNLNTHNNPQQYFFSNASDIYSKKFLENEEFSDTNHISIQNPKKEKNHHNQDDTFALLNEALSKHTESHHPVSFANFSINQNKSHNNETQNSSTQPILNQQNQTQSNNNLPTNSINPTINQNQLNINSNQIPNLNQNQLPDVNAIGSNLNQNIITDDLNPTLDQDYIHHENRIIDKIQNANLNTSNSIPKPSNSPKLPTNATIKQSEGFSIYKEPTLKDETNILKTDKIVASQQIPNLTKMVYEVWIR